MLALKLKLRGSALRRYIWPLVIRFCPHIIFKNGTKPGIRNILCRALPTYLYRDECYDDMCSPKSIERYLIKQRVKLAKRRHDYEYLYNINKTNISPSSQNDSNLNDVFPPRRSWAKLKPEARKDRSPLDRNKLSLRLTVARGRRENPVPPWLDAFDKKVSRLNDICMASVQAEIAWPEIMPIFKKKEEGVSFYRPLSKFSFDDNFRIASCAKYFREKFDPLFSVDSYAFRGVWEELGRSPTHHDAIKKLIAFRKRFHGRALYVAECDIKKFFDIISHDTIFDCFAGLGRELAKRNSLLDYRSVDLLKRYLEVYRYEKAESEAVKIFKTRGEENSRLDAPVPGDLEPFYRDALPVYGIPQGGALSPIIANMVLHYADEAIRSSYKGDPDDLFYARYCDDMIIVHPDRNVTAMLYETYSNALKELRLAAHDAKPLASFGQDFYNMKSKHAYLWSGLEPGVAASPWVSFVGYQINHEGRIRVREASLKKERDKQREITSKTLQSIKKKGFLTTKSSHEIVHRLRTKLYSMAVGRVYLNKKTDCASGLCWCSGFNLLAENDVFMLPIKRLDAHREKMISLVRNKLRTHKVPSHKDESPKKKGVYKYYGHPFSYAAPFTKHENENGKSG